MTDMVLADAGRSLGNWLYSNGATLLGAAVTLLAAWIAWSAVQRQLATEREERRRAERFSILTEAMAFVRETYLWATDPANRQPGVEGEQLRRAQTVRMSLVLGNLHLLGLTELTEAVANFPMLRLRAFRHPDHEPAVADVSPASCGSRRSGRPPNGDGRCMALVLRRRGPRKRNPHNPRKPATDRGTSYRRGTVSATNWRRTLGVGGLKLIVVFGGVRGCRRP